ncbi:MAG: class I SAM-dependent methyltransferase [Pseudonocardia sp.]
MSGAAVAGPAAARWRELQQGRGIPPEILAAAPDSPWRHNPARFAAPEQPDDTPSRQAAVALLGAAGGAGNPAAAGGAGNPAPAGGTVLDVGCGGGAASLAVYEHARHITGLDIAEGMLAEFERAATARGVPHRAVLGSWPEAAGPAGPADVVLCHHVGHNTVELGPFAAALGAAARRGVVYEMYTEHPMAWMDPLWVRFHDLHRPRPATLDDALAVLAEVGITPQVQRWERPAYDQPIEDICRRLCVSADRADEVRAALAELPPRRRTVATLTWAGTAD